MDIAYIILSHRFPEQLNRLIHALGTEQNSYFVHIDKRANAMYRRSKELLRDVPNLSFSKRFTCNWGHFNIIKASFEALKLAVASQKSFDYVVLLSGQDYPIKSPQEIQRFFQINSGQEFIEHYAVDELNPWTQMPFPCNATTRVYDWHFVFRSRLLMHLPFKRKFPCGYKPYLGSQWWALSRDCAEYIVDFIDRHPAFLNFFKNTYVPDEIFFQSVVLNSPFRNAVTNKTLTFLDWENPNPNVPATLLKNDFNRLNNTPHLFARKFDQSRDSDILDLIDQKILFRGNAMAGQYPVM
jgi:hypothetical protein